MRQLYTPEEQAKLQEMFDVVNAWDLTRYTEKELLTMDRKIDYMYTAQTIHEISFEEGMQKGLQEGIEKGLQEGIVKGHEEGMQKGKELALTEILTLLNRIQANPDISDAALREATGLSAETIQALRGMGRNPQTES